MKSLLSLSFLVTLIGCSGSDPVKGVCCLGPTDCATIGLTDPRPCELGQACVDNLCEVPDCATNGCQAAMPVCDLTTGACGGCTESAQCSSFGTSDVCDPGSGSCVQCVGPADCSDATSPVCDAGTCRGCKLDSECDSGACGDDGGCVPEANVVYLDPSGVDVGSCVRAAPCKELAFAVTRAADPRQHIVFAAGTHALNTRVQRQDTPVSRLYLHGHGAKLVEKLGTDGAMLRIEGILVTMRDFEIFQASAGINISVAIGSGGGTHFLDRLHFIDSAGIGLAGASVMRDVVMDNVPSFARGLTFSGTLSADRVRIAGGTIGVEANVSGSVIDATNVMVSNAAGLAVDLAAASGAIRFVTVADSGSNAGSGPRALRCSSGLTIQASIIWAPGTVSRVSMSTETGESCVSMDTIAGPTPVPGAMSVDPLFVDPANRNYHLMPNSPARDTVDSGPATDVDGEARPKGARFDIGADEI